MRIAKIIILLVIGYWLSVTGLFAQMPAKDTAVKSDIESGAPQVEEIGAQTQDQSDGLDALSASQNVTLDFKEADIRNVLKIISYKAGVNIVATPEVRGNVTVRLVDVPWEKALDTIVKTYDFGYEWLNSKVVMVSTLEKLSSQRKARQEAQEMEPVDTQSFVLNFSKAADLKPAIEKLVSSRGKFTLEERANVIIITDTKSNLARIAEVIQRLDKVTLQVNIEAKVIEATLGTSDKLGIDWQMKVTAAGSKRPTTVPFDPKGGLGRNTWMKSMFPAVASDNTDFDSQYPYGFPFPQTSFDKGAIEGNFNYGTLDFTQFQAVLEVLKTRTDTKIISNPRITTLNNQEAKVFIGTIIPIPLYQFSKEAGAMVIAGYKDQEVGVRLIVTPNINEQNYITLNIKPNVDDIIGHTGPNNERPIIAARTVEAKVMIKDGNTLVMGGLISEKKIKSKKGVPILKDIPILDFVFAKREDSIDRTELLFFITPHIVRPGEDDPKEIAKMEKSIMSDISKPIGKRKIKK